MLLRELLREGEWWDDGQTVTLFHGTSSALLPAIKRDGLLPPPDDLAAFVRTVLTTILPNEAEWPPGFLEYEIKRHQGSRSIQDRHVGGRSLFFFPHDGDVDGAAPNCARYARSYAQHGGEIAYAVWRHLADLYVDAKREPPPPRWPHGKPVVLTVEVPKQWCNWNTDLEGMRERLYRFWQDGNPNFFDDDSEPYEQFDDLLRDVMKDREVQIARAIPNHMITAVRYVDASAA